MDDAERRREYARRYRERNRELLRAKERARRGLLPPKPPRPRPTPEERFWTKVNRGASDECWEWTAGTSHGYGSFGVGGRAAGHVAAHRFSWELVNGPVPAGLFVLHHCDNPPCVNPAHLYAGTSADNVRDMVTRGRAKGGHAPGAFKRPGGWNRKTREDDRRGWNTPIKLTDEQVREIRQRKAPGISNRRLAEEFGVTHVTIGDVLRRKGRYARVE